MREILAVFLLCCGTDALAAAACTPVADAWITLEVVAPELASGEPVEVIDIDRAGCLSVRYPSFDRRAGQYRRQLEAGEMEALERRIATDALRLFDADAVRAQMAAADAARRSTLRGEDALLHSLQCGDVLRLRIDDGAGQMHAQFEAPLQQAGRHPQIAPLVALAGLLRELRSLAHHSGRERIADASP